MVSRALPHDIDIVVDIDRLMLDRLLATLPDELAPVTHFTGWRCGSWIVVGELAIASAFLLENL
jgi:hypothetical protein